jgi:hypothetical protein
MTSQYVQRKPGHAVSPSRGAARRPIEEAQRPGPGTATRPPPRAAGHRGPARGNPRRAGHPCRRGTLPPGGVRRDGPEASKNASAHDHARRVEELQRLGSFGLPENWRSGHAPAAAAGRDAAQDAAGDRGRRAPRTRQARRPAESPAARARRRSRVPRAGGHRDPGDLRAARESARHLALQVADGGPRLPLPRARDLSRHRAVPAQTREDREATHCRGAARTLREELASRHPRRGRGPAEAHLQHLAEDAPQAGGHRAGIRHQRRAHPRGQRAGMLRRARPGAQPVALHRRRVRRLHRQPEGQLLPLAAHGGDGAGQRAARGADPHARDARARRARRGRALALQGRRPRRSRPSSRRSTGCGSCWRRARMPRPIATCSTSCAPRSSRTGSMLSRRPATSSICPPAPRRWISPTRCTPVSATTAAARASTAAWCS